MKKRLLGRADEALIEIAGHEGPYFFNVSQHPEHHVRRAVRVLAMIGELHKRGFQRLRLMPHMSPSGLHWRCAIGSADYFYRNHGARLLKDHPFFVRPITPGGYNWIKRAVLAPRGSKASS
jgi:hypothetical protein